MANFFTKPFARSKKGERENSQRGLPLGKEPERLVVNSKGEIECLQDWANRNDIKLSEYMPEAIYFLRRVFD